MNNLQLFLYQHAIVHSAEVSQDGAWSMVDSILQGLSEDQMRWCPGPGKNSIAWLLWHMARTEDVTMNLLVAGRPQVFDEGWRERLGLSRLDIGTGMQDEEVADFSARVNIPALLDYRNAVGRRTREIAQALKPEDLESAVNEAALGKLISEGALTEKATRLKDFWGSKKKAFILAMPATGHNFMHLSDALGVRNMERDR